MDMRAPVSDGASQSNQPSQINPVKSTQSNQPSQNNPVKSTQPNLRRISFTVRVGGGWAVSGFSQSPMVTRTQFSAMAMNREFECLIG